MGLVRDQAELHVSSFSGDGVSGGVVFLLVDNVDALHEELLRKNVPIALEPTDQTWGNREMYIKDPDGNSVRFVTTGASLRGWQSVFGQARLEEMESVDTIVAEEFERIDPDEWR